MRAQAVAVTTFARARVPLGQAGRIRLLTITTAFLGVAVLAAVWRFNPTSDIGLEWWGLAVLFALLEPLYVPITFRRSAESITLRELPLAFGLLVASPRDVVIAGCIGPLLSQLAGSERRRPDRVAFNTAQYLLNGGLAAVVYHAIAADAPLDGYRAWFGAGAGSIVSSLASLVLVLAAISASEGRLPRVFSASTAVVALSAAAMNASLGTLAAVVVDTHPPALLLMLFPVLGCGAAYRSFVAERLSRSDLSFLYEAAQSLSVDGDHLSVATTGVTEKLGSTVGADVVQVWLYDGDHELQRWVSVGDVPTGVRPEPVMMSTLLRGGLHLGRSGRDLRSLPASASSFLGALGLVEAVLYPLVHDESPLGFLVIGRQTAGGRFRGHYGNLVPVFTRQLATRLASNRLGEAVDELARQRDELAITASQDSLTGLANRMLFLRTLEELIRRERPVTVAFVDLDDFKNVNDTHGHLAGDQMLQHVAKSLRASFRAVDVVARLGGDEFAVIAIDTTEAATKLAAERAIAAVARPIDVGSGMVRGRISVGVAGWQGAEPAGRLLARADAALYVAKRAGKGRVVVADPEVDTAAPRALANRVD